MSICEPHKLMCKPHTEEMELHLPGRILKNLAAECESCASGTSSCVSCTQRRWNHTHQAENWIILQPSVGHAWITQDQVQAAQANRGCTFVQNSQPSWRFKIDILGIEILLHSREYSSKYEYPSLCTHIFFYQGCCSIINFFYFFFRKRCCTIIADAGTDIHSSVDPRKAFPVSSSRLVMPLITRGILLTIQTCVFFWG